MEAGQSQAEVARWLGVTRNVVSRFWKKFQTTANVAQPRKGRPRVVTTLNQDRYMSLFVRRNRRMTASQLRSDLNAATGVLVSTDTIRRRLHKKGLYARRPIICVPLTPPQKRARKLWCRQHVAWNPNEWRRVMFTDESKFSLNSDSHRVFVWREVGTRNNPRNMVERGPYGNQGFMVWAGIFLGGRTALHIFRQGTLTGQRYRDEILAAYVMPQALEMGENFLLMDDNARPHRAEFLTDSAPIPSFVVAYRRSASANNLRLMLALVNSDSGFNMMTHSFLRALRRFKSTTIPSPLPKAKGKQGVRGQPTPESHPHLLQAGQVAPGITRQEFQARRYRLMEAIQTHCHRTCLKASNHVAIIPSATKVHMSDKIPYPFRQNSEFLYLTGFQEPDSILLLTSSGEKELPEHQSTLFVPRRQAQTELWEGQKTGPEDAVELLGVDGAYPLEDLEKFLESMLTSRDGPHVVWYDFLHPILPSCHKSLEHLMSDAPNSVHFEMDSLRRLLHQVRVVKSEAEISLMRKSAAIAGEAISRTIQAGYQQESQMWARMEYECRLQGAERLAYPPVVGGGSRANTIHYTHNNCLVEPPDMVLMDAGCEYHGYVSDITRTWPVSGQFTPPQRALYEAVLETQQELIELCAERLSLNQLYSAMTQLLGSRLQSLGIVPARVGKIEMNQLTNNFCPHHVGHYLGMDVHDCPEVSRSDPLTPGMVITIEPGLYLREDNPWVPPEFRGLGVRIEDDVLITSGRPEVLSSKCPKDPDEICALVPRT
ncbi:XPNPEP3 [Cordylochernes scorpioides]|uniref:XPNPEP3 n=1 Tax=Cordylochernes scorpioides TaxID=51811 RepID=A0ABY6K2X8_9ARAC|nr:XPNPEP3 [Cordylochernes scorpioides]